MHTNLDTIARLATYPIYMNRMRPHMARYGFNIHDSLTYATKKTRTRLYTLTTLEINKVGAATLHPLHRIQIGGFLKCDEHGWYGWYCVETLPSDTFKGRADFDPFEGMATHMIYESLRSFCDEQPQYLNAWFKVQG